MNSILRIIALSSVLVHLWAGCGRCCILEEGGHHHVASKQCEAADSPSSDHCCSHGCSHESPPVAHEDAPCECPCDDSDDSCDCCTCVFIIPSTTGESNVLVFETLQEITLASISLMAQLEFTSGSTFPIPSPEDIVSDPRSLRARIAVFLL